MTALRHVGRRLATYDTARLTATSGRARLPPASASVRLPPARHPGTAAPAHVRALHLQPSAWPRAGYMSSRSFATGPAETEADRWEKYYKILRGVSAAVGILSTVGGTLAGLSYYVISAVNKDVDEKLRIDRDKTSAKLESEKANREEFKTLATKTHLETVRQIDQIVADLRVQFNDLSLRVLESKWLEVLYRSQMQKAQEVLDREGATTSSEVHLQLLPLIKNLESQIALLTEEVAELRLISKTSGCVPSQCEEKDDTTGPTKVCDIKVNPCDVLSQAEEVNANSTGPLKKENPSAVLSEAEEVDANSTGPPKKEDFCAVPSQFQETSANSTGARKEGCALKTPKTNGGGGGPGSP